MQTRRVRGGAREMARQGRGNATSKFRRGLARLGRTLGMLGGALEEDNHASNELLELKRVGREEGYTGGRMTTGFG